MPIPTRILVGAFLLSGLFHFLTPEVFLALMPPFLPEPTLLIYLSGALEIVCALGLIFSQRWAPLATAAVLLAIWPANWWFAIDSIGSRELWEVVLAWLRLPLQIPLIVWALRSPVKEKSS